MANAYHLTGPRQAGAGQEQPVVAEGPGRKGAGFCPHLCCPLGETPL